jgi:hypothetical protein
VRNNIKVDGYENERMVIVRILYEGPGDMTSLNTTGKMKLLKRRRWGLFTKSKVVPSTSNPGPDSR